MKTTTENNLKNFIKHMKKIISAVCIMSLAVSLFGCSKKVTNNSNEKDTQVQTTSAEQTTIPNEKNIADIYFTTKYQIKECLSGYFIATTNNGLLYGMLDKNGNTVIDFEYDNLTFKNQSKAEFVYAYLEGKYGTLDLSGNILIPLEITDEFSFSENLNNTLVQKNGIDYIISKDGKINIRSISSQKNDGNLKIKSSTHILSDDCYYNHCVEVEYITSLKINSNQYYEIYDMNGTLIETLPQNFTLTPIDGKYIVCSERESIASKNSTAYLYDSKMNRIGQIAPFQGISLPSIKTVADNIGLAKFPNGSSNSKDCYLIDYSNGKIISNNFLVCSEPIIGKEAILLEIPSGYAGDFAPKISYIESIDTKGNIIKKYDDNTEIISPYLLSKTEGNTTRLYNINGEDIFSERFYSVDILDNKCVLVSNANEQMALISPNGKKLVDFGGLSYDKFNNQSVVTKVLSPDMYCAVTINENSENEIFAFVF